MSAVLLARVSAHGGPGAVTRLLREANVTRTPEYLLDTANWISYDEALALWRAGAQITHHPQFARAIGEDSARRLNGSQVAALLRSLGSPERVYEQLVAASSKYSIVSRLETVRSGPGFADVVATANPGFPMHPDSCAWRTGLLTQPPALFGLPPGHIEHEQCAAFGAPACVYRITWKTCGGEQAPAADPDGVERQLEAMRERLRSMFETAADLIAAGQIEDVLARITDRAAGEVRAPRYLLAVRIRPGGEIHCHHKGLSAAQAAERAGQVLAADFPAPHSWIVSAVRSNRQDYGRLVAMYDPDREFFPQERELLDVYARYAATALDSATALLEARERYEQTGALLELARALAVAGTSGEIARRLADAVPLVVDCDRVGVYFWDLARGELVRPATFDRRPGVVDEEEHWSHTPLPDGPLEQMLNDPRPEPIFIDEHAGHPALRERFGAVGALATVAVPLTTGEHFLGMIAVSVMERPERLQPSAELLDQLSGAAALATTALQNGRLVDEITHQALHDSLTGLANRGALMEHLRDAIIRARQSGEEVTLLYLDLDCFKPVNDELGHDAGDQLLIAVSQRLASCTRAEDTVARLGGDEFAVLLASGTSERNTERLTARLRETLENWFVISGCRTRLGVSIGRAVFPRDADGAEALVRAADRTMFEAKRHSRTAPAVQQRDAQR